MDSTNNMISNVVILMKKRGHEVLLYGTSREYHNIRVFKEKGFEVYDVRELKDDIVESCDVVFCTDHTLKYVMFNKIYIFLFNFVSMFGTSLSQGGDFMFSASNENYFRLSECCVRLPLGSPKYDNIKKIQADKNTILFIDSGHYPFGYEAKNLLAEILIKIAITYPEYKLIIKPRFLKEDKEITHMNKVHIYELIKDKVGKKDIPSNMILLMEHKNLDELIENSGTVICMYTTSFVEVILRKKNLIILGDLPSKDSFGLRNDFHWEITKQQALKTGCFSEYDKIFEHLPEGIKPKDSYLLEHLPERNNVSEKICDIVEYVEKEFIIKGKFPKIKQINHKRYEIEIESDYKLDFKKLMRNRIKNHIKYVATQYIDAVDYKINIKDIIEWINNLNVDEYIDEKNISSLEKELYLKLYDLIIENYEVVSHDPIAMSYYLESLFNRKRKEFDNLNIKQIPCERSYFYFAMIDSLEKNDMFGFCKYYSLYMELTSKIEYEEYITDQYYEMTRKLIRDIMPFPYHRVEKLSKVIIYGAGIYGRNMLTSVRKENYCEIQCLIDKNYKNINIPEVEVTYLENAITKVEFDYIVIAVSLNDANMSILELLTRNKIPREKIIAITDY